MPKVSEMFQQRPFLQVLAYGETGAGKTTWAALSPNPLVVLTEPQGMPSLMACAPDAHVLMPDSAREFLSIMDSVHTASAVAERDGQVGMVLQWGGEEIFFQTLVVDSLTDVQEKVVKSYENDDFDITQQSWGRVHRMVSGVLDMLRALPVNLIMTCLCSSELYSDGLRRSPLLYGKRFPAQVGKWFSAVGFVTTAEDNGELAHGVVWRPRKDIVAKPAPGFPAGSRFDLTEKGSGTLGSLLCRSFPNMGVAATEHDHATKAAGPIKE